MSLTVKELHINTCKRGGQRTADFYIYLEIVKALEIAHCCCVDILTVWHASFFGHTTLVMSVMVESTVCCVCVKF